MQRRIRSGIRKGVTQAGLSLVIAAALGTSASAQATAGSLLQHALGSSVLVFSPRMSSGSMQQQIDAIYQRQQHSEFGTERDAILFEPGDYKLDIPIGFYTQILGLGSSPDAVHITGNVHADASAPHNNATTTFWRGAEGFSVTPAGGTMQWAVSQAVPFRRMHVHGDLVLNQNNGWASGGWMSDSRVDGNVASGTQQQWISRNSDWHSWTGSNWNMVFVGVPEAPQGEWPTPPYTKIARTPVVREKPFLAVDDHGGYSVRVPAIERDSAGITWASGATAGTSIPLARFYVAHAASDTAASLNKQLAQGRHLLFTPGIYTLDDTLRVEKPGTVVLGLGFATLKPVTGKPAMQTGDGDGIILAGLLFDAGEKRSPVLLEVGPRKNATRHTANPISLHDIFFRVGGAGVGSAGVNLRINSNDVLVDHTWIWRADHGAGVGWESNLSDTGLEVNGDDVTIYGLFVEHHQRFQVLWNGDRGRTYFYQSEIPYDPPTQASYTSGPGVNGWASYKVADAVTTHEAWGLGVYSVFRHPDVVLSRAIETPVKPGITFHHMITVCLDNNGEISNVIDDAGGPTSIKPRVTPKVTVFPANH